MPLPSAHGLYDPRFERDACGVGFVANVAGHASHALVRRGIDVLLNLVHRGAAGSDPLTGDGAGLLVQIPDAFLRAVVADQIKLPPPGQYGVGTVFLPQDRTARARLMQVLEDKIVGTGQRLLGWRDVPVDPGVLGEKARATAPSIHHVFVGSTCTDQDTLESKLFVIRKWAERTARESGIPGGSKFYVPSLSSKTLVYKGLLLAHQLSGFYKDLSDERLTSSIALVHQRFSTNTFPTWELAQPFRLLAHNGEINTIRGNAAWMRAREQLFDGRIFGEEVRHILPTITPGGSDSAMLDNVAELLMHAGRSLPHVMMMLVPAAWQNDPELSAEERAFFEYHSCLIEPWDGPAALAFTDGRKIGALLDRNGLRPARWTLTHDGVVVLASETGVLDIPAEQIARRGRLEPGRMFLVDTQAGRILEDAEIRGSLARQQPYARWLADNAVDCAELPDPAAPPDALESGELRDRQRLFGYTDEDLRVVMTPMAASGQEAVGSMGTDTPLAVLSETPQPLFNYFKQHFAQVTNPPIDPLRESMVMSLSNYIGGEGNLLFELPDHAQMLRLRGPVLTSHELEKLRQGHRMHFRQPATLPMLFPVAEGAQGLKSSLDELCRLASLAVLNNHSLIVLSDRGANEHMAPVPSLLATGAVHHHLMRNGTRMKVGILVDTADAREVHHFCLLLGYGAGAVVPYLALDSVRDLARQGRLGEVKDPDEAEGHYIKAAEKGLLKVMSKMGISTLQSYHGAQIFEALGLSEDLVERYFTGTASRLGGIDLEVVADEIRRRHLAAFASDDTTPLEAAGEYHWRAQGQRHLWSPAAIAALQRAVRTEDLGSYREYSDHINRQAEGLITLRGMWNLLPAEAGISLSAVEPAQEIVRRFATGAMSFGSISAEAHENLAIAMNRIGGKSNTGEGGESAHRYQPDENGDSRRSAIKQVASARFGVTPHYLVNADELQIKIAQGAKPGEGGQLPGHKVDAIIAKTRHSTPGVTLISPPPHHDIYSIEDLAQLIFDLKMVNPRARISVKLVAEAGVGTIAAGVAKAHADVILISGYDGGTGASPLTSIKHAGIPWELGLSETHQVLVKNDLRSRVILQADGQLRTGRDVVIAALLGAEEFGFATAPLVASGCLMMRKCHLNTCPVGIATQDPALRARFRGAPEHVIRYMFFVAEEAREIMATMGFTSLREMVGRVDRLRKRDVPDNPKAARLDFSAVLTPAEPSASASALSSASAPSVASADPGVEDSLDHALLAEIAPALRERRPVTLSRNVKNVHRTVGAMIGGEIARLHGEAGLPEDSVVLQLAGSAGQSFGAFLMPGMTLTLHGDANDYVGKGMAGGRLVVRPPEQASFDADKNILIGNVALYGATGGHAFFRGVAGERFGVRNSGAVAVVEGVGDHGCEYMTGGRIVVIGRTGRNFGAGMSGGLAFVLDEDGRFPKRINPALVELEALSGEDAAFLAGLLEAHAHYTGSKKARSLLACWEDCLGKFRKVVPVEYRRALQREAETPAPPDAMDDPLPEAPHRAPDAE
ncbi:MAG: glutamate synthase large subunit [Polyangiaceae bacterium]